MPAERNLVNWLNLPTSIIRRPEYVGSEPTSRATWLNVVTWCCEQENGGRIVGAKRWKDRQWQQTCGVMLSEIEDASLLLQWDGDDLVAWSYPAEKEAEVQARREAGRSGGKKSGEARLQANAKQNGSSASSTPSSSASTEGKEKGKEEEGGPPPPDSSDSDAHIPTIEEVRKFGAGPAAIPPGYCDHFHAKTSEKRVWLNGYGKLVDWKKQIVRWWASDRAKWVDNTPKKATPPVEPPDWMGWLKSKNYPIKPYGESAEYLRSEYRREHLPKQ